MFTMPTHASFAWAFIVLVSQKGLVGPLNINDPLSLRPKMRTARARINGGFLFMVKNSFQDAVLGGGCRIKDESKKCMKGSGERRGFMEG